MLPTNGLRYQAQLLRVRNSRELSVCWLRDNLRDNDIWCTGHYCMITGIPVNSCGCDICFRMDEYEGVKSSYLHGFIFVRSVLSEYPIGNVATNSPQDQARIRNYVMTESHISYLPRTWTPPTITQQENNTDNVTDNTDNSFQESDSGDSESKEEPTIHYAQMMKAAQGNNNSAMPGDNATSSRCDP